MSSSSSDGDPPRASMHQLSVGSTGASQVVGTAAPGILDDASIPDSELPPIVTPAPFHHAPGPTDETVPAAAAPPPPPPPPHPPPAPLATHVSHNLTPSDSTAACTVSASIVTSSDKRASISETIKADGGASTSTLTFQTVDSRRGSAAAKNAVTTSTDEEISEEDSNDSTFRSDVLDPLISCDPTATTATSEGGRQRRPAITKQNMIYVLRSMDPNMVKTATQCLEAYIKARKWTSTTAFAREYYACSQVHLTAIVIHRKICKSRITFLQMREYIENIAYLFDQFSECGEITRLGGEIRQLILMVEYLASCLERCSGKGSTDWIEVARLFPMEVVREVSPAEDLSPLLNRIRILEKLSGREGGCHFGLGAGNLYRVTLSESIECAMRLSPLQEAPLENSKEASTTLSAGAGHSGGPAAGQTAPTDHSSVHPVGGTMDRVVCAAVSSPFIFSYYASFTTFDANVLLLEVVDGINLQLVLNFTKKLSEDLLRHVLAQLMMAVEHLHFKGFIHRDIKLASSFRKLSASHKLTTSTLNKALSFHNNASVSNSRQRGGFDAEVSGGKMSEAAGSEFLDLPSGLLLLPTGRIKLADLTLAKMCIARFAPSRLKTYSRSTPYEFNDREMIGTIPYVSPEVLRMRPYGRATDWWSVGMTAFVLTSGQLPFRNPKYKSVDGLRSYSKYPSIRWTTFSASQKLVSLIKALLVRRPSQRLCSSSYIELRSYSFFADVDWTAVINGSTVFDCSSLIEQTRASSEPLGRMATLGSRIRGDPRRRLPLFTYTSAGFSRVVQKLMKKRKVKQQDIVDPHEVMGPDVKYTYKFKDFRKSQARRPPQSRKSIRLSSSSGSSGSDEEPQAVTPAGGPSERASDLPTASNARTTSIMSFVKELRNGL